MPVQITPVGQIPAAAAEAVEVHNRDTNHSAVHTIRLQLVHQTPHHLQVIHHHCDYLVDLHTGSLKRTNLPQIRGDLTNNAVFEFSQHFGGITVLHGQGTKGTLRRAAVDVGMPTVTLEAGGPNELDESAVDGGVKALETLLQNLGIQPTLRFWGAPQPVFYDSQWVRADQGGILMSQVKLGDRVKEGVLLGRVVDPVSNTGSDIRAPFPGRVIGMAVNQVVQTGFAAYHLGIEKAAEDVQENVQERIQERSQEKTLEKEQNGTEQEYQQQSLQNIQGDENEDNLMSSDSGQEVPKRSDSRSLSK